MYGIKGYIFLGELGKLKISNPPFEALTGYDKGHEYMKIQMESITKILATDATSEVATGYMFLLVPEENWKEEE